jgi:hypothetical protein
MVNDSKEGGHRAVEEQFEKGRSHKAGVSNSGGRDQDGEYVIQERVVTRHG